MGGRYYILGSQLGVLQALLELGKIPEAIAYLKKIEENQYIGKTEESRR